MGMTTSQRAALGVAIKDRISEEYRRNSLANLKKGEKKAEARVDHLIHSGGDAIQEAADVVGVGRATVSRAESVRKQSPAAFQAIERGEMTIGHLMNKSALVDASRIRSSATSRRPKTKQAGNHLGGRLASSRILGVEHGRDHETGPFRRCSGQRPRENLRESRRTHARQIARQGGNESVLNYDVR